MSLHWPAIDEDISVAGLLDGAEKVMELRSAARLYPRPSLAATSASGYPVALEARAELRERRALTSITR